MPSPDSPTGDSDAVAGPAELASPASGSTDGIGRRRPRLLYFVTEDWYFWSHRLNIASAALEAGYDVVVVTRVNQHAAALRERGFRVVDIQLQRGRMFSLKELRTLAQVIAAYRREKPDLVHHVGLKPVLYGGLAALLTGVGGRVNALAGLGYIFIASRPHIRIVRALIRHALKWILRSPGSWLILQNRDDLALFQGNGIASADRTVMIRGSGVDTDKFRPGASPPAPLVAAQVSRMLADKGIRELVEAARLLHRRGVDIRVRLVGQTDPDNPSSIREVELRRWVDEGVVEWTGFQNDIAALWQSAHIAILASRREGLPKSLLEAAASGRPMVGTDVPGNREIVIHEETGLLVPCDDPVAMADAVERLCRDAELRERLGRNARDFVVRNFSDGHVVAATMSLYGRVWTTTRRASELSGTGGPPPCAE
jgi:glycosyltransferase involved in cell wall biosynthesis